MEATIHVHTYKEGLLSKLAHDLRFTVGRFEITARGTELTARFDVSSLRVDGPIKDGRLERGDLSEGDRQKIRDNMLREVLRAREHPEVRFVGRTSSREPPFAIEGDLTLAGVTRPISFLLLMRGDRLVADVELTPSHFGIKPFRALGGTLRVQDRVRVSIDAGAEWLTHSPELNASVELVWTPATRASLVRPSIRPGS